MNELTIDHGTHLLQAHAHFWTWEIPVYFFFGGVAAGIMLLVVLLRSRSERQPGGDSRCFL